MTRTLQPLVWLIGLVLALGSNAARAAEPPPALDQALRDNAPKILKDFKDHQYSNVGVLKFMAQNGKGPARDNLGPINSSLADRLEVALVLALNNDDDLGIISNATKGVAESGNGEVNHLTPEGRQAFFRIKKKYFMVPWQAGKGVDPDAFLTGEARLSSDRRNLEVTIQVFDRKNSEKLRTVCEFKAATDLRILTETGVTFSSRGVDWANAEKGDPSPLIAKATENAPQPEDKPETLKKKAEMALTDLEKSPIKLEILYTNDDDNKPVEQTVQALALSPEKSNVLLRVPTPKSGQKVSFRLTNRGDETYGVVLKINGHNSIKKEPQDALDCKKWILKGGDSITVTGYQIDDEKCDPFIGQTPYESELNAVFYGDNAGTINLVVFRGTKTEEAVVMNDSEMTKLTVSRGMLSLYGKPMASTLEGFKDQLKKEAASDRKEARDRGLVTGSGNLGNSPVKKVDFHPLPIPVLSATIRYYEPRESK